MGEHNPWRFSDFSFLALPASIGGRGGCCRRHALRGPGCLLVPKDQRQPTPVRVQRPWRPHNHATLASVARRREVGRRDGPHGRRDGGRVPRVSAASPAAVATGSLRVETVPAGTEVVIGGKVLGITPVTLSLAAGPYEIQLGRATDARRFTVDVVAGSSVIQHIEMAPAAAAIATGALRIQTEPSKLPVFIDGAERGVSPLTVDAIQPARTR